jgi:uncharacterized membrane protein
MSTLIAVIQLFAIIFIPYLIMKHSKFVLTRWFGTIGTAYVLGILVAGLIYGLNVLGLTITLNADVGEIGSHVAIGVAIPLLLFSANLVEAKKLSKTVLQSFLSLIVSTVIVSTIAFYIYARTIDDGAILSGMAIGVYTGGTPNLNAIANIFGLDGSKLISANLSDMVIGALFYVFLLVGAKPLLSKFLRARDGDIYITEQANVENFEAIDIDTFVFDTKLLSRIMLAVAMTALGAVFGIVLWLILGAEDGKMIDLLVPTLMITVTVLGIAGSFLKKVRETKHMNVVGQYLILVFSFALASSIDFSELQAAFGYILVLYGIITIGVFLLHSLIAKWWNIDVDCTMITLTAGLYGPAFVPAITKQIKNDDLTAPGLITGSIGYAVGTFLGMMLVYVYLL